MNTVRETNEGGIGTQGGPGEGKGRKKCREEKGQAMKEHANEVDNLCSDDCLHSGCSRSRC